MSRARWVTHWVKLTVVMPVVGRNPRHAAERAHDIATRQGLFVYELVDSVNAEEMYRHIMPDSVKVEEAKPDEAPPQCEECGGDLGGTAVGRLETHAGTCSRFPL
jgi:hypothetical protein